MIEYILQQDIEKCIENVNCQCCLHERLAYLNNEIHTIYVHNKNISVSVQVRVEKLTIHTNDLVKNCMTNMGMEKSNAVG